MQLSEFIDNSLKALALNDPAHPKVIDIFAVRSGKLTFLMVFDTGYGMYMATMKRWAARGSMPLRKQHVRFTLQSGTSLRFPRMTDA